MDIPRGEEVKRRRTLRRIALIVVGVAAIAGITWAMKGLKPAAPSVDGGTVWRDSVKRGPMDVNVRGIGRLTPEEIIFLPAAFESRVQKINHRAGDKVSASDVIMVMSDPDIELEAEKAQWSVRQEQAKLSDLKITLESTKLDQRATLASLESDYTQAKLTADRADRSRSSQQRSAHQTQTVRQPEATRRNSANYSYQLQMSGPQLEPLRRVLFREHHPMEKVMRIGLGPLSVEGIFRRALPLAGETRSGISDQSPPEGQPSRAANRSLAEFRRAMPLDRLQKILAAAGVASRRKAEEIITAGRVTLNGKVVTELGTKADLATDTITVDGKPLQPPERFVYFLLNKPKGYVTTVSDPNTLTVMQLLGNLRERVYPVGRLDYASEGLLLLTNDGALAQKLTKAGSHVPKSYHVKVSGKPNEQAIQKLRDGVTITLDDNRRVKLSPTKIHTIQDVENPCMKSR